jgi:hypothetical protein
MDIVPPDLSVFPKRYVAKNIQETGWRIWDRSERKWWGSPFHELFSEVVFSPRGKRRRILLS